MFNQPRSQHRSRNFKLTAIKVAVAGLSICLLSSCHAAPLYSSSGQHIAVPVGHTCTEPRTIPMDLKNAQSGVTEGSYYVTNDSWNASHYSGLSQSLYVCDYNNWYTISTMNNATSDGAVKTSPNVQQTWYPTPARLTRWKSITSHYSDVPPGAGPSYGTWEFEYDVWLNGLADKNSTEIMIWTFDNGQAPSGSLSGSFTDAGHTYDVYHSGPPYQYVAFVDRNGDLAGDVNLINFFRYVISKGWMPPSSALYQICNGVELVSTNGKPERFGVNNFSISMEPYSEGQPRPQG
jgi:hypothetical protein